MHGRGADVLRQPFEAARARNGHNPWLLREEPGECDLCRRRPQLRRDTLQERDHRQIRRACIRLEPRRDAAEVTFGECGVRVDGAREEPRTERAERDKTYSEFGADRQDAVLFDVAGPQRILALYGREWLH